MTEARARESREEGETRRRANADDVREARVRRIADRGWKTLPVHIGCYIPTPYVWEIHTSVQEVNVHTKVAEASEATCTCICTLYYPQDLGTRLPLCVCVYMQYHYSS